MAGGCCSSGAGATPASVAFMVVPWRGAELWRLLGLCAAASVAQATGKILLAWLRARRMHRMVADIPFA
eukprot:CAMPEP_0115699550 /NCGR_PEP_ID=MMETSP0272-20121206/66938_1 /TAXON_ID=71861 /ORGANISM="Scrippsiella trochoidea, Strain CCMP3099" /LENGTH=68 /DNA_ID=CAMNT_0003139981 /DNA_START=37 /DNA_END=239 /DNA_ORIENTATION=+